MLGVLTVGCTAPPQHAEVAARMSRMGGTDVQFRVDGEPIDVAGESPDELSMADAIRLAFEHDPQLQASLARVRAAAAQAQQARLLPNPLLSVVFRWPEGGGDAIIEAGLAADLVAILKIPRATSAADNQLRAASQDALVVALDLLAEVQERYVSARSFDAQLGILRERREIIHRLVELARARVQAGESSVLDVVTLEAELISIDAQLIDATAEQRQQRLQLARLIGEPSGTVEWQLPPWDSPGPPELSDPEWIQAGLENRPEAQARRWELAARGDDVSLAGLSLLDGAEIGVAAERDPDWSVGPGLAVPLPIFDWGQARRDKARAELVEARHELVRVQRQIVQEIRAALTARAASQQALRKVRDELVPTQQRRTEQAEAQYKAGFADITATFLAQQDLLAAQLSLIDLEQKAAQSAIRLERAAGTPNSPRQQP